MLQFQNKLFIDELLLIFDKILLSLDKSNKTVDELHNN